MMYEKLWKDIQRKFFSPVYLLYGEELFLIEETKNLIVNSALLDEELEFNLSVYDLEETPVELAIEDCQTVPFFGERKVVIVQKPVFLTAEKPKEKVEHNLKVLEEYIQDPVPSTIFIIIGSYEKLDERKKITKLLLKNSAVLNAKKLSEQEIISFIHDQFRKKDLKIDKKAANKIYQLIGSNLMLLHNEINKIALYCEKNQIITEEIVDLLVSRSLEDSIFALVDKVLQRKLEDSLSIYYDLLKQNEEPIRILASIASQFRFIYQVKALLKKGYGQKQIAGLLKVHPFRVKLVMNQSNQYDDEYLLQGLNELAELDYKMKTGYGDKERSLELFFIKLLTK